MKKIEFKKYCTLKSVAIVALLMIVASARAAEGEHHEPSVFDLVPPFINFAIFFSIIFFAVRGKLIQHFQSFAEEVKSLMSSAEQKNKDAQEKLQQFENKIKNLDSESVKIKDDYESDYKKFQSSQKEETETTIHRMERDFANKLAGEKAQLVEEMNKELVEAIIEKAKGSLHKNQDLKNKASHKLISSVQ